MQNKDRRPEVRKLKENRGKVSKIKAGQFVVVKVCYIDASRRGKEIKIHY